MKKKILHIIIGGILALALFVSMAHAQTGLPGTTASLQATPPPEGVQQISIGASYSSTSGPLDNGSVETMQKRVWKYGSARLDAFTFGGGFLATTARFQPQASLSHLIKPNEYLNTRPILPYVNLGGGVVKNSNGVTRAAWAVGAGIDYRVNGTLMLRCVDFTLLGSRILPGGTVVLSNFKSVATGLTLNFPNAQ